MIIVLITILLLFFSVKGLANEKIVSQTTLNEFQNRPFLNRTFLQYLGTKFSYEYLLTTQQAGRTDWGPLSNRWTGNVHFSLFSIFWSSSTQRIPRPAHQACHNLDQNTSRKAGADLDHCSFLGSVHTGAKPKITVFRYKQILPVLLPAVPERTLL